MIRKTQLKHPYCVENHNYNMSIESKALTAKHVFKLRKILFTCRVQKKEKKKKTKIHLIHKNHKFSFFLGGGGELRTETHQQIVHAYH